MKAQAQNFLFNQNYHALQLKQVFSESWLDEKLSSVKK